MAGDEIDIPDTGAIFTFGRSRFAENVPSRFYIRNDRIVDFDCGDEHTAIVCETGRLYVFGSNDYGQLGLDHSSAVTKPRCVKSLKTEHVTHVACGRAHTVVSTDSGKLLTWGNNSEGQLGLGDQMDDSPVPRYITAWNGGTICQLSAGSGHSAVLTVDGQVFVWGSNSDGQLGLPDTEGCVAVPTSLPIGQKVVHISCGYYHSAFVTDDGLLFTCGETEYGKLGVAGGTSKLAKVETGSKVTSVSCGGSHTVAVTVDGGIVVFGNNANGQIGMGSRVVQCQKPSKLLIGTTPTAVILAASCGESHSAFVTDSGYLYTCGDGRHGKLCTEDPKLVQPTRVNRLAAFFVEKVSCGGCHTMVLARYRSAHEKLSADVTESSSDSDASGDSMTVQPSSRSHSTFPRRMLTPIPRSSASCNSGSDSESCKSGSQNKSPAPDCLASSSDTIDVGNYKTDTKENEEESEQAKISDEQTNGTECDQRTQPEVKKSKLAKFFSSIHIRRSTREESVVPVPSDCQENMAEMAGGDVEKCEQTLKTKMVHLGSQRKSKACAIL